MNTRVYLNGRNAPDRSRTARGTLSGEEFRLPDVRTGYPVARLNNMEVESLEDFPRGDGYSVAVSPRPELDTGGLAVVGRVLVLAKLLERSVTRALKPLGLSLSAFDMLAMIRRHGEPLRMTPAELARATMLTSGAMTNRIDRLEERGLVRREPDPFDGRSIHVVLTEEGRDIIDRAIAIRLEEAKTVLRALRPDEVDGLRDGLGRWLSSLAPLEPQGSPDGVAPSGMNAGRRDP